MSININKLVQGALTESVLQQIAPRVGCAPESATRVVSLCAPALIGAMMEKASTLDGARSLFAAIMAPSTNARIAEELPHAVKGDDAFRALVETGRTADASLASRDGADRLAERIADYTGVASSAVRSLTGVVSATVLGVLKRHFSQHGTQVAELPALLDEQMPVVRANLTESFAQALGLGSVAAFLAGAAARLKAVSAHFEHPAAQAATAFAVQTAEAEPPRYTDEHEPGNKKSWFWVASAAALALYAVLSSRGCTTNEPQAMAAADTPSDAGAVPKASHAASAVTDAVAPAPSKGSIMAASVDASGMPTINATVGSQEERQRLLDQLAASLGLDRFHANITVDPDTKPAAWLDKLGALTPVLTQPGAQLRIAGDDIEVSGAAADVKFGWPDKLKALFGAGWTVGATGGAAETQTQAGASAQAQPAASAETSAKSETSAKAEVSVKSETSSKAETSAKPESTANAAHAAKSTATATCDSTYITQTLAIRPVNFRIGSKTLPKASLASLAKSARALKQCSTAARPIQLRIAGYTDTTGNEALNLHLSKQRAQAVRAYLIKQGVPASTVTAAGFGQADPIADNATREGRMANRRIEIKIAT